MDQARALVTSYCFPPYREATSVVSAKRIREFGEPVDVVCCALDTISARDSSLTSICGELVRRFAAIPSPPSFSSWSSINSYVDLGYRVILRWQQEQTPYERLYSRAQFAASHFLAARYKTSHPDVEWTAEFSDPLSHNTVGRIRHSSLNDGALTHVLHRAIESRGYAAPDTLNLYEWCEAATFALADQIIFTNELQQETMLDACHDPRLAERARAHSLIAPHPTLPRSFYSLVPSHYDLPTDRINIGYFGRFYVNRGVGLIVAALRALPKDIADRLRLHIFTSEPDEITEMMRGSHAEQAVVAHPYLDYLDFLALTDRMDLLLVNDAVTPDGMVNPYLPSKWSDYKGSHTPVWAILEEDSSLAQEPGIAYRTPVEHVTAIQQVFYDLATDGVRSDRVSAQAC